MKKENTKKTEKTNILKEYLETQTEIKILTARLKVMKPSILSLIGDNNTYSNKSHIAIKTVAERQIIDSASLKANCPDIWEQNLKASISITLKVSEK